LRPQFQTSSYSHNFIFIRFVKVLDVLAKTVAENGTELVQPSRSQAIPLALCEAPYRTFLKNNPQPDKSPKNLVLYCMPTSVTELLSFGSESTAVRSHIFADAETTVTAIYDVNKNAILGGDVASLVAAIAGNSENQAKMGEAAIVALSELENSAAKEAVGPQKRKDIVIVVGSGGREHALAVAVAKSPLVASVICCPGNGGTAVEGGKISNAEGVNGKQDNATVISLVKRTGARMVVVGPEAPLVDGLVDELATACPDVLAFGPTKAAAELEASKVCIPVKLRFLSHQFTLMTFRMARIFPSQGIHQRFFARTRHSNGQISKFHLCCRSN
jgi:hypothetical protein